MPCPTPRAASKTRVTKKKKTTKKKPRIKAEFTSVSPDVSRLLTIAFEVAGNSHTNRTPHAREPIFRAALAHGADIRARLVEVCRTHPYAASATEVSRFTDVEPDDALIAAVKSIWESEKPYAISPGQLIVWYRIAGWFRDKRWQGRLRTKLTKAVEAAEGRHRATVLRLLTEVGASEAERRAAAERVAEEFAGKEPLDLQWELESALREQEMPLVDLLLPMVDVESRPLEWAIQLARAGCIQRAQALLDGVDPERVQSDIDSCRDDGSSISRARLDALALLDGPWADAARQARTRRCARLTSPERLELDGVEYFFNVQSALDVPADEKPHLTPQHVLAHVESVMESDASAGDKVMVRGKAVELLVALNAYEEAASLTKVLRRKLGSSKLAKQCEYAAWAHVAGAAAGRGHWDEALEWAEKFREGALKGDTYSVDHCAAHIGRGLVPPNSSMRSPWRRSPPSGVSPRDRAWRRGTACPGSPRSDRAGRPWSPLRSPSGRQDPEP